MLVELENVRKNGYATDKEEFRNGITCVAAPVFDYTQKYKTLTVRLYGFSEYFVSLPKWQQLALLNRTQYTQEDFL